jgi:hypothetical protein
LSKPDGAQGAPRRIARIATIALLAGLMGLGASLSAPPAAAAASHKVVIVVGPVGSQTSTYISYAKAMASQARSYGASVYEVYSPNATWSRVKYYAQNANLFIYLGHGNGWPSPYSPFQTYTKDGLGLNATANNGNSNTKYWGEYYIRNYIRLAPNAVVFFNHLCYASGNGEPGMTNPSLSTAIQRVDNYGHGFVQAGARAVFAYGIYKGSTLIYSLFKTNRTMSQIFWADPGATPSSYSYSASSSKFSWARISLDPYKSGAYYRSVVGSLAMTAADWR